MRGIWAVRLLAVLAAIGLTATVASADNGPQLRLAANLSGFNEVTSIVNSGSATFRAEVHSNNTITYTLKFSGLTSAATQSHLHFAQSGVNGSIFLFLCTNLGNGPAGTPACPANGGTVTGTLTAADVLGLPANNLTAGDFQAALRIIRAGDAYANIHTVNFPAGEIRGQVHADY